MKTKDIIYLVIILLLSGVVIYFYLRPVQTKVVVETREDIEKIDSLNYLIRDRNRVIDSLRREKNKVHEKVVVKIRELKTLPADSIIKIFHANTEKYGECGSSIPVLQEDSTVLCSPLNIVDANIIAAKYEGSLEEKQILSEIIWNDSAIISEKDSVIHEKSVMLQKTEAAYTKSIEGLEASMKREKVKRKAVTIGGGIIALILGYFALTGK